MSSSPAKVIILKTPIKTQTPLKSPSIFACKPLPPAKVAALTEDESNDESMDYSFDFREAARKSKSTTNGETTQSATTQLTSSSQSATCLMASDVTNSVQVKKSQSVKTFSRKGSSEKNLVSCNNSSNLMLSPLRSVSKKSSQSRQKDSQKDKSYKRLKQLTMTQALTNLNETSCSFKASNPNTTSKIASIGNSMGDKNNLYHLNIKDEPIMIVCFFFQSIFNSSGLIL